MTMTEEITTPPNPDLEDIEPVTDLSSVEHHLARVGDEEADIARLDAAAAAAITAITKRHEFLVRKTQVRAAYRRTLIEEWVRSHRDEIVKGKRKTRDFLTGSISIRTNPEKVVVNDPEATLAWAQDKHLELVNPKPTLDKKALDKLVLGTGEIPPGVDVNPATETILIKPHPLPTIDATTTKEIP
jgi:phage host-nuclease inhibitor protein Gam